MAALAMFVWVPVARSQAPDEADFYFQQPDFYSLQNSEEVVLFFDFAERAKPVTPRDLDSLISWWPATDGSGPLFLQQPDRWSPLPPGTYLDVRPSRSVDSSYDFPGLSFLAVTDLAEDYRPEALLFDFPGIPNWWMVGPESENFVPPPAGSLIMEAFQSREKDSVIRALQVLREFEIDLGPEVRTAAEIVAALQQLDTLSLRRLDHAFEDSIWYWSPIYPSFETYSENAELR